MMRAASMETLLLTKVGTVLLLLAHVSAFNLVPCEVPNESAAGFCLRPNQCRPYQQVITGNPYPAPEINAFLERLRCGQSGVCCTSKPAYANPRVQLMVNPLAATTAASKSFDLSAECGMEITSDRIFGGQVTSIDEFPWLALLFYQSRDSGMYHPSCGGVLIAPRWVLTAAHCVTGRGYENLGPLKFIRLGEHNLDTEIDCNADDKEDCADRPLDFEVERIIYHPNYVSKSWDKHNDLALIKLVKDAPYTDFIRHICLPNYFNMSDGLNTTSKYVAAGWGHTDYYKTVNSVPSRVKLKVTLPYVEQSRCRMIYANYTLRVADSQFCAGGLKAQDTCRGDSGSPLMFYHRKHARWFAYGVVSRGPSSCGTEGIPSLYTNLFKFGDWVRSTMAAN